jgi:hypothetical protein
VGYGGDGGNAEAVAQPLGRGLRPVETGRCYDGVHAAPVGHARPRPQADPVALAATGVQFADAMHQVERIERAGGTGMARQIPAWRFFRVSNTSTPAARSTRSTVSTRASDSRLPTFEPVKECKFRQVCAPAGFFAPARRQRWLASRLATCPLARGRSATGRGRDGSAAVSFMPPPPGENCVLARDCAPAPAVTHLTLVSERTSKPAKPRHFRIPLVVSIRPRR